MGEPYNYTDDIGDMCAANWQASEEDMWRMAMGNITRTVKELEDKIARRKAEAIIIASSTLPNPDWNNPNQKKWFPVYDDSKKDFYWSNRTTRVGAPTYFSKHFDLEDNPELLQAYKTYCGVKDGE